MAKLRNLLNPTRARWERVVVIAFVVFVGMLLTQGVLDERGRLALSLAAAVWAVIGWIASNYLVERRPW
jgi:hypothetical protein